MTLILITGAPCLAKKQASPIEINIRSENSKLFKVYISAKHCELLNLKLFNFTTETILREEIHNCDSLPVRKTYKNETNDRLGLIVEAQIYGKVFKKNAILRHRNQPQGNLQADAPPFIELPAAD